MRKSHLQKSEVSDWPWRMPELPEVESARRLVSEHCCGHEIIDVITEEQGGGPRTGSFDDIVHADRDADATELALRGRTVRAVHRKGKQMWFELSNPSESQPLFHFGMTGAFVVKGVDAMVYKSFVVQDGVWPPRFCKLEIGFAGGFRLAFCDPRRLGRIQWRDSPKDQPPISELAADPVLEPMAVEDFCAKLSGVNAPIKAVLLDQKRVVCGVGNWIADEILYQTGIHPATKCSALETSQATQLHQCIQDVCTTACSVNADSKQFPAGWLFHYRWGKGKGDCIMPNGDAISFETVAGRTSAIVSRVQKEVGGGTKRKGKPAAADKSSSTKTKKCASPNADTEKKPVGAKKRKKKAVSALDGIQKDTVTKEIKVELPASTDRLGNQRRVAELLKQMSLLPVSIKALRMSRAGRLVSQASECDDGELKITAAALEDQWKQQVSTEIDVGNAPACTVETRSQLVGLTSELKLALAGVSEFICAA